MKLIDTSSPLYLRRLVRELNAQALTGAGFYFIRPGVTTIRCVRARLNAGRLQVKPGGAHWTKGSLDLTRASFEDGNGREIVASREGVSL